MFLCVLFVFVFLCVFLFVSANGVVYMDVFKCIIKSTVYML